MAKPNVDIVTLLALQELATGISPTKEWWMHVGAPDDLLGKKIKIETGGEIISEMIGAAIARPDRVYIIGVDMPAGSSVVDSGSGYMDSIEDPYLDGLEYSVHRRGVEYMMKGVEWQNDVVGGGIRLTQTGDQFVEGDIITVSFKPVISNVLVTPDAVGRFTFGSQIITANTTAGSGFDRKLILIQGASSAAVSYTLNPTYPENVLCLICTGGGSNKQSIILPPPGQTMYRGGAISRHVLGQVDYICLIRIGTVWYVGPAGDRWKHVGQIVFGGIPGPDTISANGQTLLVADYPGIEDYLDALETALPGSVVSMGAWATDKTKWGLSATQIGVPLYAGMFPRFLDLGAGVDPDRSPTDRNIVGSKQAGQVGEINFTVTVPRGDSYNGNPYDSTRAGRGQDGNPRSPLNIPVTVNAEKENRPINVGLPALIHI